jgi:beta-fructofuranosidase
MKLTRRTLLNSLALNTAASLARPLTRAFAQSPSESPLHDPQRPSYHLQPARNWMNDPCAPVFYRGKYHMFHQYNPHAAVWGDMHWAHATSPDMVHWTRLPVALTPTPGGPDSEGCFTGSSILHNGTPAIIYTGVQTVPHDEATLLDDHTSLRESQNVAIATDSTLGTWRKLSKPALLTPPPGLKVSGFRDPTPFHFNGKLYLVVGSGERGKGGMTLLYRATDDSLLNWEYLHPLAQGEFTPSATPVSDPVDSGEMWECPDFFSLGEGAAARHILIFSTRRRTYWQSGILDPATLLFHPEKTGELDYGNRTFYAPKTQLDAHGNRILWGWLPESRSDAEMTRAGWSGMMSMPRRLYQNNGDLHMEPATETRSLRAAPNPKPASLTNTAQEFSCVLQAFTGSGSPTPYTLSDPTGPILEIRSDPHQDPLTLRINDIEIKIPERLPSAAGLHVFLDNSVIEIFVDSRFCVTQRFYARSANPVATLTIAGPCTVARPQSFPLKTIWTA